MSYRLSVSCMWDAAVHVAASFSNAVLPLHYQFKDSGDSTVFNRSQLMQLTIAALPRGSDVMWCVVHTPLIAKTHMCCSSRTCAARLAVMCRQQ